MTEKRILWSSTSLDLTELSDLPLRGSVVEPISQHNSVSLEMADLIGSRVCGPACVAMALQVYHKYPIDKPLGSIEFLLVKLAKLHISQGDVIKYETTLDGQVTQLAVGLPSDVDPKLLSDPKFKVVTENGPYQPFFSLVRGYDHRGSAQFFSEYGLKANFFQEASIKDLENMLKQEKILILSVIPRRLSAKFHFETEAISKPAHLVLVTDVIEINGKPYFHVLDPDYDLKNGVMPKYLIDSEQLEKICNWRGTWISE